MAVDDKRQGQPTSRSAPDPAKIRRQALIRPRGDGRQSLYSRSEAYRAFPDLSSFELEDSLNRILVEPQQVGHRPIAEA